MESVIESGSELGNLLRLRLPAEPGGQYSGRFPVQRRTPGAFPVNGGNERDGFVANLRGDEGVEDPFPPALGDIVSPKAMRGNFGQAQLPTGASHRACMAAFVQDFAIRAAEIHLGPRMARGVPPAKAGDTLLELRANL